MQRSAGDAKTSQSGLSITEVMMAVVVSVIILAAVAAALASGLKANQVVKGNEQATGLANKEIEAARNLPFDQLVHESTDLNPSTDSAIVVSAGVKNFRPIAGGPLEKLVQGSGGSLAQHVRTDSIQGLRFTIKTYVTEVANGATVTTNQTRRVTTVVTYPHAGTTFTARSSTLITRSRRGLPEPKFEVSTNATAIYGAWNNDLVMFHTIRNLGVVDSYDILPPVPSRSGWAGDFDFYRDVDNNGLLDKAVDTVLTETNGNTYRDTGSVQTDETIGILIVYPVPESEPFGVATVTTTVASGAHSTVTRVVTDTANINFALHPYYPYNQFNFHAVPSDSNLVGSESNPSFPWPMLMDPEPLGLNNLTTGNVEPFVNLPNYGLNQSDEDDKGPGRVLKQASTTPTATATLSGLNPQHVAVWDFPVGQSTVYGPAAYMYIWAANHPDVGNVNGEDVGCDTPIKLKVYLNRVQGSTTTAIATLPKLTDKEIALGTDPDAQPSWHGGGCEFTWQVYGAPIPDTTLSAAMSQRLQVRVVMDDPGRTIPVMLAYGINYSSDPKLDIDFPTQVLVYGKS